MGVTSAFIPRILEGAPAAPRKKAPGSSSSLDNAFMSYSLGWEGQWMIFKSKGYWCMASLFYNEVPCLSELTEPGMAHHQHLWSVDFHTSLQGQSIIQENNVCSLLHSDRRSLNMIPVLLKISTNSTQLNTSLKEKEWNILTMSSAIFYFEL